MRTAGLLAATIVAGCLTAAAQDIAGVEDCTKTSGLDRRTGCLQANVNFLNRTMTRNALEAHRRLQAAESELAALKASLAELRKQVEGLRAEKKVDAKPDPKPDPKKK